NDLKWRCNKAGTGDNVEGENAEGICNDVKDEGACCNDARDDGVCNNTEGE
ncbi:6141_t:CDS:2, partial [Racocetra persica]